MVNVQIVLHQCAKFQHFYHMNLGSSIDLTKKNKKYLRLLCVSHVYLQYGTSEKTFTYTGCVLLGVH